MLPPPFQPRNPRLLFIKVSSYVPWTAGLTLLALYARHPAPHGGAPSLPPETLRRAGTHGHALESSQHSKTRPTSRHPGLSARPWIPTEARVDIHTTPTVPRPPARVSFTNEIVLRLDGSRPKAALRIRTPATTKNAFRRVMEIRPHQGAIDSSSSHVATCKEGSPHSRSLRPALFGVRLPRPTESAPGNPPQ